MKTKEKELPWVFQDHIDSFKDQESRCMETRLYKEFCRHCVEGDQP